MPKFSCLGLLLLLPLSLGACDRPSFSAPQLSTTPLQFARQPDPLAAPWTIPTANTPVVAFTPDNRLLAVRDGTQVKIWNVQTRQPMSTLTATAAIGAIALTPDGTTLIGESNQALQFWNLRTGQLTQTVPLGSAVHGLSVSPDGRSLAVAGNTLQLWDLATRQPLTPVSNSPICARTYAATFLPDGQAIAYITTPQESTFRRAQPQPACKLDPELTTNQIEVRSLKTGAVMQRIPVQSYLRTLATNGQTLVAALSECQGGDCYVGGENSIKVWNLQTGQLTHTLAAGTITPGLALSRDGRTLVSTTLEGTLQRWDLPTGTLMETLPGLSRSGWGFRVIYSPGNQLTLLEDRAVTLR